MDDAVRTDMKIEILMQISIPFSLYRKDDQFETNDDSDFSDSEDEDNFNVNIRDIDTDVQAISRIPEEERSTHFIAIRISNPQIIRAAKSVQVTFFYIVCNQTYLQTAVLEHESTTMFKP